MAIYIKGVELPKGCRDCRFEDWGNCIAIRPIRTTRHLSEEREVYCPLIEVSEPHGRLIDADAIYDEMDDYSNMVFKTGYLVSAKNKFYKLNELLEEAPTVIEGSE